MQVKKYLSFVTGVAMLSAVAVFPVQPVGAAEACNGSTFDGFTLGSVNGQGGWVATGAYDHAVVDNDYGYTSFGCKTFRISNAITSGSFGDWVFSPSVANEAGETSAANDAQSGGTRQDHFEAEFAIASTVPGAEQPGLQISVSPDRGDGARMSYLRFSDQADGIHVFFDDYQDVSPFGVSVGDTANGCGVGDDFVESDIATMDRTIEHTIKFVMDFVDGPRNDVVKVYVDGVLKKTGTSWEDYFRYCEGNPTRTVDSLIFQARSGAGTAPATSGSGFVIDNLVLSSGVVASSSSSSIASSVASSVASSAVSSVGMCTGVSTANLHGHWMFDEGTGTSTADSSGNGHTGTLESGPTWINPGAPQVSPNPNALSFDGTNDQVRVAGSNALTYGTQEFTVSAFVKTTAGNRSVLGNFNGSNRGWGLYVYANNTLNFFGYGDMGHNDAAKAGTVLDNQWHHVAGVYTRSGNSLTITTYVDGVNIGSQAATVGDISSASDLLFGRYLAQPHHQGGLDDVRVYGRALSASEIAELSDGCPDQGSSSSMSSSVASSVASSAMSSVSSSVASSSSSSSVSNVPMCDGKPATIYVRNGRVVGGPNNGGFFFGFLVGTNGPDVIVGTQGNEIIQGRNGRDTICGRGGNDILQGQNGPDTIYGGPGNDLINGGNGPDSCFGGAGNDLITQCE